MEEDLPADTGPDLLLPGAHPPGLRLLPPALHRRALSPGQEAAAAELTGLGKRRRLSDPGAVPGTGGAGDGAATAAPLLGGPAAARRRRTAGLGLRQRRGTLSVCRKKRSLFSLTPGAELGFN